MVFGLSELLRRYTYYYIYGDLNSSIIVYLSYDTLCNNMYTFITLQSSYILLKELFTINL